MKILIIAENIFPFQSPRSFRATNLAKQLARDGHEVILYAALGNYDYSSFTEETKVIVKPIKKLRIIKIFSDGSSQYNIIDKFFIHLLKKIVEYPEIEFLWKVPKILKNEKNVDLLITVAFPYPIHWGAAWAKYRKKADFPRYWISDCGDPYYGNPMQKRPFYFKYVEEFWSRMTDKIAVPVEEAKSAYLKIAQSKIIVIPQGFEFTNINIKKGPTGNACPHFIYTGIFYSGKRDPKSFFDYLVSLNEDFVFSIYTKNINNPVLLKYKELLGNKLDIHPYIPREQLIYELSCHDFLINFTNPSNVQVPSKLIDYYQAGRPILNISTPFNEKTQFENALHGIYESEQKLIDINQYDIRNVAKKFVLESQE